VTFESAIQTEFMDCKIYGLLGGSPPELPFPGGCENVDACQVMP